MFLFHVFGLVSPLWGSIAQPVFLHVCMCVHKSALSQEKKVHLFCSCRMSQCDVITWQSNLMNCPQRTAECIKEAPIYFSIYFYFLFRPGLYVLVHYLPSWRHVSDGRTNGQTNRELAVLSFARLWTAFAK